jgi:hypothetical protein
VSDPQLDDVSAVHTTPAVRLPEPPLTGDGAVDDAVRLLDGVTELPVEEQPAVYDVVHRTLQDRLADVDG